MKEKEAVRVHFHPFFLPFPKLEPQALTLLIMRRSVLLLFAKGVICFREILI